MKGSTNMRPDTSASLNPAAWPPGKSRVVVGVVILAAVVSVLGIEQTKAQTAPVSDAMAVLMKR